MARKTKQEKLRAHLEAVKRLRQEVTAAERKATRKRNDQLAAALAQIGLAQLLLNLSPADRQRIGGLATVVERLRELARVQQGADEQQTAPPPTALTSEP